MGNKKKECTYKCIDNHICFIAVASDRPYRREITKDVAIFLFNAMANDNKIKESELVALNRWIMRKDKDIDFAHIKDDKIVTIAMSDSLKKAVLWNMK